MENNAYYQEVISGPEYRIAYNINPDVTASNTLDPNGNPTGGFVKLETESPLENDVIVGLPKIEAVSIVWQNGPRGQEGTDELLPPNGAFVEDVLWAALQRLEFFNESKFRDRANSMAITHIEQALQALKDRQLERSYRKVEGKHEV
jgi:hypothetical protein